MQPTKNEIAAAWVAVELETKWAEGKPLIEETIGPADAWTVPAERYRALAERYCRVERERDEAMKDVRWYRAAAICGVALAVIGMWM